MKKLVFMLFASCAFIGSLSSEEIILKNGKQVEGEIIERSENSLKIDFYGVALTYSLDEIESINGEIIAVLPEEKQSIQEPPTGFYANESLPETNGKFFGEELSETVIPATFTENLPPNEITPEYAPQSMSKDWPEAAYEDKPPLYANENFPSGPMIAGQTSQINQAESFLEAFSSDRLKKMTGRMIIIIVVSQIAIALLMIVSLWKIFIKAGIDGWKAIVPVYNLYIIIKISGKPGWWLILFFLPLVSLVVNFLVHVSLAEHFGKNAPYGVALVLLPFVFFPILAFGDAQYSG